MKQSLRKFIEIWKFGTKKVLFLLCLSEIYSLQYWIYKPAHKCKHFVRFFPKNGKTQMPKKIIRMRPNDGAKDNQHSWLNRRRWQPGNPYWRETIGTVVLLVLTSLYQLTFRLKRSFNFVAKQATLMRRSTVLSLPFQLVFLVDNNCPATINEQPTYYIFFNFRRQILLTIFNLVWYFRVEIINLLVCPTF